MLRLYGCITQQHDLRLVLLALIICLFGCYTALRLLVRARSPADRTVDWRWLTAASVVAGAAVWTTHFVAMLAFRPGIPVGYDVPLTALSIVLAIVITWLAFALALRFAAPATGGAVFGLAIGIMHFTGMAALDMPAAIHWDAPMVLTAFALGVGFGAPGLRSAIHRPGLTGQLTAVSLLGAAIAGLHFTAMAAATLTPDPALAAAGTVMPTEWLAIALAMAMVMITLLGLSGSAVDQHLAERRAEEAVRLRAHICELEATKRQLEATARDLESALEAAASGSQAKSQFLATISHELRTPLNAIVGFSEMLAGELYGPLGDPRYKDYAHTVKDSGMHLLDLINDVLDYSKVDAGHLTLDEEELDLIQLAQAALRMIAGQAESGNVQLIDQLPKHLPYLVGDQRRVRQVLLNLLSNAVKFTPEGGEIRVFATESVDGVTLAVADTGIGIAPEDIPRAFERFGQVDNMLSRRYEGTGLGLPLSKRLMELHNGTLALESTLGAGTTALARFPRSRIIERHAA